MVDTVIAVGDKLHIMTRRLFDGDIRRHFVGEVKAVSTYLTELRGYTFIFQPGTNRYCRLPELRTRLFAVGEAGYTVNKIPRDLDLDAIGYQVVDSRLVLTDGKSFVLPINEFGVTS